MNFLIPKKFKRASGIYKITCRPTSKIYIGSASDFLHRYNGHKTDLRNGRHSNSHLLNAYEKYGSEKFDFELVELVSVENLLEREQFYLDSTGCCEPNRGFNICRTAGKVDMTIEVRAKISAAKMGHEVLLTTREKIAKANSGRKHDEQALEKIRDAAERRKGVPRTQQVKNKISSTKQETPYIYTDDIKRKMKDAYQEDREYKLILLSEARKKLIGKTLNDNERRSATIGGYKQALRKRSITDRMVVEFIKRFRDDKNFEATKALGKSYSTFTDIFKGEKPAYLPVLIKIGYVQLGGSSMKDLRNPEFIAKLSLDIEFLQGADNLIEDPVELYDFLNNIRTLNGNLAE